MKYGGFPYKSIQEIESAAHSLKIELPFSLDYSCLGHPVKGKNFRLYNALVVQPMEGCDSEQDGSPGEMTFRRYLRLARGGAGLIWMEAIAVTQESRANPRQLMITDGNLDVFSRLVREIKATAMEAWGVEPLLIAQLTHSGRWSRPEGSPAPIRACKDSVLDTHQQLPDTYPVISDQEIKETERAIAAAAVYCREAGFDGVDLKACHLYLYSEMLGAHERIGIYGGSYENRTRMMLETTEMVMKAVGKDFIIATRLNVHDNTAGHWGNDVEGKPDYTEPLKLMGDLIRRGETLFNITMGTPYYNPHINRPYARGGYEPPEDPLIGVARLMDGARVMQQAYPDAVCVATGFSYMREFSAALAAGIISNGWAKAVGFGRQSLADPSFANHILHHGGIPKDKLCLACGKCTMLMRAGYITGCPVRDQEVYLPLYRKLIGGKE
ncbi:MAG: flavin oxidoreductase/NADH oxidase [Christensenellales bacterium]